MLRRRLRLSGRYPMLGSAFPGGRRLPPADEGRRMATTQRDQTSSGFRSARIDALDRYFRITERGSSVRTEVVAGITTFLTMAYILFLNPAILGAVDGRDGRHARRSIRC